MKTRFYTKNYSSFLTHFFRFAPCLAFLSIISISVAIILPAVLRADSSDKNYAQPDDQDASSFERLDFDNEASKALKSDIELLNLESIVTIASKREETASKAPSIVSVITAEDIENIGAGNLSDIFQTIPGFDIIKDAEFGVYRFGARGLQASDKKIKVLIDGHSINMPFNGRATTFFDDLPLKNVKKIEVIRGPGAAIYGANAFLAVINIITKDVGDIDGVEVSSGFGSYDTQEYSVLFGKTLRNIDVSGFVDFYNTNGISESIKVDATTGQAFSNTPGDTDDSRNKYDANIKMAYKDLKFMAKYMNKDTESFVGSNFVLTDEGENRYNYAMGEISYEFDINEKLKFKPRAYYDQYDMEFFAEALPDGFTTEEDLDNDGDLEVFPDGMLGKGVATNRRLGGELQFDYDLFENNSLTFGFNYEWERQDNVQLHANFDPLTNASLGSIQNVSEHTNWIREVNRQIWAIYFQDKWDLSDSLGLTLGVRHDHYSDFEGTTNPRIGLVWNFINNATIKLLYGQAFRAPSFAELYSINNPVLQGNPNLAPETIRTYEAGLDYKFSADFHANVNYFFNVIRDEINSGKRPSPNQPHIFENIGGSNIQGVEFEIKADFGDKTYAFANYTYQDAESKGDPVPDVPKHKGNVGVNFELTKYLNANLHAFISDDRARAEKDDRDDSPGYALLNLTLIAKEFFNDMKIKASLFNLLDKDYNDPAPINTIPTDLPRPGRTFFIELNYKF